MRWWVAVLLCLGLASCGPPKELEGRPTAPPDVAASRLLPPGVVRLLRDAQARDAAEVRTAQGGWLAALRFASAAEAHAEFVARVADRAARPDVTTTRRVDFGHVQWLRYGFARADGPGTGLLWQSDRWVFVAEAPDGPALAGLIADSRVGGTGPLPAAAVAGGWPTALGGGVLVVALAVAGATVVKRRRRRATAGDSQIANRNGADSAPGA